MIYLDTSAFLKLVMLGAESEEFERFLATHNRSRCVSSVLLSIESRRNVRRYSPRYATRLEALLRTVDQVPLHEGIVESASWLPGDTLRALDAIHFATALLVRDELDSFITYDKHLAAAVERQGLPVSAPA